MTRLSKSAALAIAFFFVATSLSATAFSFDYVRTKTCGPEAGVPCRPNQVPLPLSWSSNCVSFELSDEGSRQFENVFGERLPKNAEKAVVDGFYAWNRVETSSFQYKYKGLYKGTYPTMGHENVVFWRDEWPADLSNQALGVTSVNYRPSNGEIVNAMMELNTSSSFQVTVPPMLIQSDLQNTVTHEAGHFLGLSHTSIRDATMFGESPKGETTKRTLKQVDKDGVSAIYSGLYGDRCVQLNSFNLKEEVEGGCSSTGDSPSTFWPLLLLGALFLRRRHQE